MKPATARSALKVQEILGDDFEVLEFEESTRTSADAAAAIGCTVAQIAKSLIFKGAESGQPVLAVLSGAVRLDVDKLAAIIDEPVGRADPDFVREHTGFAIGGVPPVGHAKPIRLFIDRSVFELDELWAAAGTPNAVFRLLPDDLPRLTGGQVVDIAE